MKQNFVIRDNNREHLLRAIPNLIKNAPLNTEIVVRPLQKGRTKDQNAKLHAMFMEMSNKAWKDGIQYKAEGWKQWCKIKFLPEEYQEGITKDGYNKWLFMPNGSAILDDVKGGTHMLTTRGFSDFIEQVYAEGIEYGVVWGEREEDYR